MIWGPPSWRHPPYGAAKLSTASWLLDFSALCQQFQLFTGPCCDPCRFTEREQSHPGETNMLTIFGYKWVMFIGLNAYWISSVTSLFITTCQRYTMASHKRLGGNSEPKLIWEIWAIICGFCLFNNYIWFYSILAMNHRDPPWTIDETSISID